MDWLSDNIRGSSLRYYDYIEDNLRIKYLGMKHHDAIGTYFLQVSKKNKDDKVNLVNC